MSERSAPSNFRRQLRVAAFALVALALMSAQAASLADRSFNIGTGADGYVEQALEQPDGKILLCGLFGKFNEENVPYLARLNSDGSLDHSFKPQVDFWVRHMLVQPNGKIIIGGMFSWVGGVSRNLIARLNPDGSLDPSFDPGRGGEVSIGTGINNDPRCFIIWSELQPDGKIIATGNFHDYNGASSPGIVRINPDGSRDASFNVGGGMNTWGRFVRILPNKQILATGWFSSFNNRNFNRLVRLNEDGSIDHTLNAFYGDKTSVYSVVVLPDGKLITSGHSVNDQGLFSREIVRLNDDGSVDNSWPAKTNEKTECLILQEDGKLILTGYFWLVNDTSRPSIARLNSDGSLDETFYVGVNNFIWGASETRDKKLLIYGGFTSVDGVPWNRIGRLILPENIPQMPPEITVSGVEFVDGRFRCAVQSAADFNYKLQFKNNVTDAEWKSVSEIIGTGGLIRLEDPEPGENRFYRVEGR